MAMAETSAEGVTLHAAPPCSWSRKEAIKEAGYPEPRQSHSAVLVDNQRIFLCGGCGDNQKINTATTHYDDVWIFHLDTLLWLKTAASGGHFPGRAGHSATLVSRQMLVFGGTGSSPQQREYDLGDMWAFDIDSHVWTAIQAGGGIGGDLPSPRTGHGAMWLPPAAAAAAAAAAGAAAASTAVAANSRNTGGRSFALGSLLVWGGRSSTARYLVGRRNVYLDDGWIGQLLPTTAEASAADETTTHDQVSSGNERAQAVAWLSLSAVLGGADAATIGTAATGTVRIGAATALAAESSGGGSSLNPTAAAVALLGAAGKAVGGGSSLSGSSIANVAGAGTNEAGLDVASACKTATIPSPKARCFFGGGGGCEFAAPGISSTGDIATGEQESGVTLTVLLGKTHGGVAADGWALHLPGGSASRYRGIGSAATVAAAATDKENQLSRASVQGALTRAIAAEQLTAQLRERVAAAEQDSAKWRAKASAKQDEVDALREEHEVALIEQHQFLERANAARNFTVMADEREDSGSGGSWGLGRLMTEAEARQWQDDHQQMLTDQQLHGQNAYQQEQRQSEKSPVESTPLSSGALLSLGQSLLPGALPPSIPTDLPLFEAADLRLHDLGELLAATKALKLVEIETWQRHLTEQPVRPPSMLQESAFAAPDLRWLLLPDARSIPVADVPLLLAEYRRLLVSTVRKT